MTHEKKENASLEKTKTKLFDYIFESSIKSSKTIIDIINSLVVVVEDINTLRLTLVNLSKIIQIHQDAIEDICKTLEQVASSKKQNVFVDLKDKKKDKPN